MKDATTTEGELLIPDQSIVAQAFETDEKVGEIIATIERECRALHLSVATPADRKFIASIAYKIARSKTAMDSIGKGLTEEAKKLIDTINARRRVAVTRLDALRDEIRKPLDDWEAADDLRKVKINTRIADAFGLRALPESSAELRAIQDAAIAIELDDTWQEFLEDATKAKDAFVRLLGGKIADAVRIEEREAELERERQAQAAELARLREAEAQRQREDEAAKAARAEADAAQAVKDAEIAALKAQLAAMQEQALPAPVGEPAVAEAAPPVVEEPAPVREAPAPVAVANEEAAPKSTLTLTISGQPVSTIEVALPRFTAERVQAVYDAVLTLIEPCDTQDEAAAAVAEALVRSEIPYVKWIMP